MASVCPGCGQVVGYDGNEDYTTEANDYMTEDAAVTSAREEHIEFRELPDGRFVGFLRGWVPGMVVHECPYNAGGGGGSAGDREPRPPAPPPHSIPAERDLPSS